MPAPLDDAPKFQEYAHPEKLVSTDWLTEHLDDPDIVIVESDEDVLLYDTGHIPGAVKIDWQADLNDPLIRDYVDPEAFAGLLSRSGIQPGQTVVFYGDNFNWWAAYALWVFSLFGLDDTRLLDGGDRSGSRRTGRSPPTSPIGAPSEYPVPERDDSKIRAFRDEVLAHSEGGNPLVDVRSPEEYRGELLHMPAYPQEGALRGGHIPGARSVPWKRAANEDGSFKSADELRSIYEGEIGLASDDDVIAYCRIGERSSHTWFVLSQLLGYPKVRNYDGSWTEWGNVVRAPIER